MLQALIIPRHFIKLHNYTFVLNVSFLITATRSACDNDEGIENLKAGLKV